MLSWRCFVLIGLSDVGGEGGGVTRVMCDSHAGLGAGHVTPRYTLHVTPGAAAAAVYIVHC